jgi:hypothetical protein
LVITDKAGLPLDGPFDTTTDMDWVGYANLQIFDEVGETLKRVVRKNGLG